MDRCSRPPSSLSPSLLPLRSWLHSYYQSNLWKGRIRVTNATSGAGYDVLIPGVSSGDGYGVQQLAGLVTDRRVDATRLYAVAKSSSDFNFGNQKDDGPNSVHAFALPVSAASKPLWSISMNAIQEAFRAKQGKRPFGIVDAVQAEGFLYVVFALGVPAIGKVALDGSKAYAWYSEPSNGARRPGFTGITYSAQDRKLIAYGGPRVLTAFDLKASAANGGFPVKADVALTNGAAYGSLVVSEKLVNVPSLDATGIRLVGVKNDAAYAFRSTDGWRTASYKRYTRPEFAGKALLNVCEGGFAGARQIYANINFLGEGPKGGRQSFPMYRVCEWPVRPLNEKNTESEATSLPQGRQGADHSTHLSFSLPFSPELRAHSRLAPQGLSASVARARARKYEYACICPPRLASPRLFCSLSLIFHALAPDTPSESNTHTARFRSLALLPVHPFDAPHAPLAVCGYIRLGSVRMCLCYLSIFFACTFGPVRS